MKIFAINICPDGSTGHIMMNISKESQNHGLEYITSSAPKYFLYNKNHYIIGNKYERKIHLLIGKFIGCEFCCSYFATKKLIKRIKSENVDIIHLHNIHAYYLNLKVLMKYIITSGKKVVWTFHDCWPFTGQCPHFIVAKCNKWKTECFDCPQYKSYPYTIVDKTKKKYKLKKELFTSIENLTIVTPSKWLCDLVKQSYLKDYDVKVINNGIDLNLFKPINSDFKEKYNIEDKKIVFGCASPWSERKGLDVFVKLSDMLSDDYKIVLVGLSKEQIENLPKNILGIERTNNQEELAKFYTMADVFVNPTREDNFPTVNIEALACGTPVVTFNTGGSPEIIDETCGSVVECDDVDSLKKEIIRVCEEKPYSAEACITRAKQFDMNDKFKEYVKLYESI